MKKILALLLMIGLTATLAAATAWAGARLYAGVLNLTGGNLRGDLKGDYQKNQIHFIGLNVVWKF